MTPVRSICTASFLLVSTVGAACEYPALVEIPEKAESGRRAERLREATEAYIVGMVGYTNCIQAELASIGEDAPRLQKGMLIARNNAAVAEVSAVVELYESRNGPLAPAGPPQE